MLNLAIWYVPTILTTWKIETEANLMLDLPQNWAEVIFILDYNLAQIVRNANNIANDLNNAFKIKY